jgi:hypothetical protein
MWEAPDATFGTSKSLQLDFLNHRGIVGRIVTNNSKYLIRDASKFLGGTVRTKKMNLVFNPKRFQEFFKSPSEVFASVALGHPTH